MDRYVFANAVFSRFSRNYMELKRDLPIRPSEMGVLNILAAFPGPHTSVMLAERLGVSKPMITAHITSLLKKGYITREQSQEDKRVYYVRLTPKAEALVDTARAATGRQLAHLAEAMGQESFDMLTDLLWRAEQILEADTGGEHNGSE